MIISNSQGVWLGFSFRSTAYHLWVMWVYIVCVQKVCIRQYSLAEQNVSRMSREKALLVRYLTLRIPVMCKAHALLRGMLSHEIPAKTSSVFNGLSLHTLSLYHTTFTIKSHNKYRVQKIEYNYNQIWHRIKANKQHLCKSQLYTCGFKEPLWI